MNEDHFFVGSVKMRVVDSDKYKMAWEEWQDKTEWVQQTAKAKELGMHRADVLRLRIEALEKENVDLKDQISQHGRALSSGHLYDIICRVSERGGSHQDMCDAIGAAGYFRND